MRETSTKSGQFTRIRPRPELVTSSRVNIYVHGRQGPRAVPWQSRGEEAGPSNCERSRSSQNMAMLCPSVQWTPSFLAYYFRNLINRDAPLQKCRRTESIPKVTPAENATCSRKNLFLISKAGPVSKFGSPISEWECLLINHVPMSQMLLLHNSTRSS